IVVDYAAESPKVVGTIIETLSLEAKFFQYPVRILLLEREATGEWFERVVPPVLSRTGDIVRSYCFESNTGRLGHQLEPLSETSLLAIMTGRLPVDHGLSKERLLEILRRVDSRQREDGRGGWVYAPRPLFAAAAGAVIANILEEGQ